MKAKDEKTLKTIAGIGALGIASYLAYTQLYGSEDTSIGGSGNFSGLGGGEGVTDEGILSGTTDSGISYNINLPQVDTSGISALISQPVTSGGSGSSVITGAGEVTPVSSKKAAVASGDSTKSETSGSLSSSLAQVFGTQAQKTNERGDYYTTAAGGGAGAIKGKSLGEMFIDSVKKVTSSEGVDTKIYTGATTATSNKVTTEGLQAALKAKKEQDQAISQTKIGAYTPVSNPLQALKDSGIVKQSYDPNKTTTTTKKEALTSSSNGSTSKKISLAEASKGSSRVSSQGTSKKVIKVKTKK